MKDLQRVEDMLSKASYIGCRKVFDLLLDFSVAGDGFLWTVREVNVSACLCVILSGNEDILAGGRRMHSRSVAFEIATPPISLVAKRGSPGFRSQCEL